MISIDVMCSRAGVYVVLAIAPSGRAAMLVEVDAAGVVHQLNPRDPTLPRDGVLSPGGWHLEQIVGIHGPFSRESIGWPRL